MKKEEKNGLQPIERLKRDIVYKGAIIDYYIDTMQIPNGNVVQWDFISHKGAAAVVPVTSEGKIIMVRQYRNSVDRITLEIPAGGLNPNEDPKTSAARELEEETGYSAENVSYLFEMYTTIGFCNEKIYIYLAEDLKPSEQNLDDDEYVLVEEYELNDLIEKIYKGEIQDSKTIAGLLAYKDKLASSK